MSAPVIQTQTGISAISTGRRGPDVLKTVTGGRYR